MAAAISCQIIGVQLGRASIPALGGALAEKPGVSSIGPFLLAVAAAAFVVHEATLRVKTAGGKLQSADRISR